MGATMLFNNFRPEKNGLHFADDIFKCQFLKEKFYILIQFSLKFVPNSPTDNMSVLVQVVAWCKTDNKLLPKNCWLRSLMPFGVTRPQWVKPKQHLTQVASCLQAKTMKTVHWHSTMKALHNANEVDQPVKPLYNILTHWLLQCLMDG